MEHSNIAYIVADNVISSLGATTEENVDALIAQQTGIKLHDREDLYPTPVMASIVDDSKIHNLTAGLEGYTRLEKMIIASAKEALSHCNIETNSNKTIFIFSTTKGNIDLLTKKEDEPNLYLDEMAKRVAQFFNNNNTPYVISNACISGVLAVGLGARLIKAGVYDNAILVGADLCSEFVISGFMSFQSVSEKPCRPYDRERDGLSMGEGVATMILSANAPAGVQAPLVMVAGASSSNDANHISGPSRTGQELCYAIEDTIKDAGISKEKIDMIDCHGTATLYNDEMESKALSIAELTEKPLISFKGYIGHTLGASGLMESIFAAEAIRRKVIFRTLGYENLGVPVPVNVSTQTQKAEIHNVLKTASGFGGCNAAIVLSDTTAGGRYNNKQGSKTLSHAVAKDKVITVNGNEVFNGKNLETNAEFIRAAFKSIAEPTVKYSKMDELCKLGVTTAEYLLRETNIKSFDAREVALVLYNRYSSLETDREHQSLINNREDYNPSPKIFVYTLANIVMGEICIRHGFKGENLFLISGEDGKHQAKKLSEMMLNNGKAKAVITGQIDSYKESYIANLELITII